MDFYITTDKDIDSFSTDLAYWLWNVSQALVPYDTGNAMRSLTLNNHTDTNILLVYNLAQAMYIEYLEEGRGPVKKYKDFIKNDTTLAIIQEIIQYFKTGNVGFATTTPRINLGVSKNGAMFHEKRILNQLGMNSKEVTADMRMFASQIRYKEKFGNALPVTGKTAYISRFY